MALVEFVGKGMILGGAVTLVGSRTEDDPRLIFGAIGIILSAGAIEVVKNIRDKKKAIENPQQIPLKFY